MVGASEFFRQLQNNIRGIEQSILRDVIQVEAEKFHAENFRKEGFTDVSFQKWAPRKKRDRPGRRRALLVKTGALRRHATKGSVRGNQVEFTMPLAYMRVHNEGGKAGRGKGFTMPKRQYIGRSRELEDRIRKRVLTYINRKLK